ncbi:hypothetical protein I41_01520 [Lacipirellula limnantheis]|uniref:Uncharacterized protein n=1 Tax=Lacipirellula limnantheis TaxID=2528024 RepID=A0A517TRJ8_9BACT|nr:hypothetical protein I41_01520 [Lacipirellula limnantheis]
MRGNIGFRNEGRPLPWQNDFYNPTSRDLHPGVMNRVDVAFTFDGVGGGIPTCAQPYFGLTDGNEYRVAIQVTADEAAPVTIYLPIRWDGTDWTSVSAVEALPGAWAN